MHACTVKHRPGSTAQRWCPVHGTGRAEYAAEIARQSEEAKRRCDPARDRVDAIDAEMVRASDTLESPDVLRRLSASAHPGVRMAVAMNATAAPEVLRTLVNDPDMLVAASVLSNPKAPTELLEHGATRTEPTIRKAVAGNPSCPVPTLTAMRGEMSPIGSAATRSLGVRAAQQFTAMDARNTAAVDALCEMGDWSTWPADDERVALVLAMHPNP